MRLPVALLVSATLLAACGDDAEGEATTQPPATGGSSAAPVVSLSLRVSDGEGTRRTARLVCREGGNELRGYLRGERARSLCRRARRLGRFLATEPEPDRICTFIYGGPQTARVRGRVGSREVDRLFSRRNGCEIDDWERVESLLAPGLR